MAVTLEDIYKLVLENRNAVNGILDNAKKTEDLGAASTPLAGTEIVRIVQGGVSKKVDADELKGSATGDANVQSDWNQVTTTHDAFIKNKPTKLSDFTDDIDAGVGEVNVQTDWDEIDPNSAAYLKNKPPFPVKYIEIDDALVYKGANTGSTIQIGDIIMRYPTTSRFIHAKVNSLPYTSDANLSFFQDITLI